jgi:hypothetical protein
MRIKNENDWVRLELSTALKRNIRVVPVLVDGGTLPAENELPEDLHPLLRRQTYEISNKRWKYDTDNLVEFLKSLGIKPRQAAQPPKESILKNKNLRGCLYIGIGVLVVLLLIGLLYPEDKKPTTENVSKETASFSAIGYWSNSLEEYAVDIDQQGNQLYSSLYHMENEKPVLMTNRGTGTINRNNVVLNFKLGKGNDTTYYKLEGIISSDTKHLRSTLTISDAEGTSSKEMDLIKTAYE